MLGNCFGGVFSHFYISKAVTSIYIYVLFQYSRKNSAKYICRPILRSIKLDNILHYERCLVGPDDRGGDPRAADQAGGGGEAGGMGGSLRQLRDHA